MTRTARRALPGALMLAAAAASPLAAAGQNAFMLAPVSAWWEVKLATAAIALEATAEGLLIRFSAARP
jgi:hypothetical protein